VKFQDNYEISGISGQPGPLFSTENSQLRACLELFKISIAQDPNLSSQEQDQDLSSRDQDQD